MVDDKAPLTGGRTPRAVFRITELSQKLLDVAPVIMLALDSEGTIQYVNPYFERLSGYSLDDIRGKDWFQMFLPRCDQQRISTLFRASFGGAPVRDHVNPIVTRSGEEVQIEWTDDLLRDAEGRPMVLLAIGHDVTARNAAQEALRESEQRLAEAQRIASIGAWEINLERSTGWWSDEQYRISGVPVGTPIDHDLFLRTIHPDDRGRAERAFAIAVATGVNETEFRIVRPDGGVRDVFARARLTRGADGQPIMLVGTNQDITERKRTEDAARRASELLRTVITGAPVAIFALDRTGVFTLSEGRVLDKLGLEPGALVGVSAFEIHAEIAGFEGAFRRALAGDQVVLAFRVGGTELEVVYAPSVDARGIVDGVIGVSFDVTERKRAEAQLHASVAAQGQLVEELREADRLKNDFIAMLSHELRNPLSAIRTGVSLLDRLAARGDTDRLAIDIIERQVTQLARLVDDLLDVSRITQTKIRLQCASIDLDHLVGTVIDDHRAAFASRGVRLEVGFAQRPLIVNGDAARITQVIGNLLHNAVKFTPSGGLTTISIASDAAEEYATIRVADTGVGLDRAMLDRIFQPFAQADRTLARSLGGLGLGLALVKGLVEQHGGDVSVQSDGPNCGTEFVVRLPLDRREARTPPPPAGPAAPRPARRVLVIEDHVDAADALRALLEFENHTVQVAHTGTAGIRVAREFRPDVVLCDLGLPDISGYELAGELRRDEALRSTRLVALSGYATPEDVARARRSGFDDHLAKPPAIEKLQAVLEEPSEPA